MPTETAYDAATSERTTGGKKPKSRCCRNRSPRACETFNVTDFCQQSQRQEGIRLENEHFLYEIAWKHNIYRVAG